MFLDRPETAAEKIRRCQGAICLINSRSAIKWPGEVLEQLSDLKMITVTGIGTDAIDLETARRLGIVVCNIPGRTAPLVAEHACALMFAVAKRAWFQTNRVKTGQWGGPDNLYLHGKTLGLVGAGNIGAAMARLGLALGMRVQAWTMNPSEERSRQLGIPFVPFEQLLRTSDVLSVHVKLTDQSRGLIGEKEIAMMKPGAHFINTARGLVADELALARALESGHLGGAGIDVFGQEPVPADHPLVRCDQVVLTPHNADQTPEGLEWLNAGAVDNVLGFLDGKIQNRVN